MQQFFASSALKRLVAACAVSASALTPLASAPAAADGWDRGDSVRHIYRDKDCFWRHGERVCSPGFRPHHRPRPDRVDDGAAALLLGIAGVAIIAGALSQANPPAVYEPYPAPNAYPPAPAPSGPHVITYESTLEPWTPQWYEWCDQRYRSFNPQTGTYRGYDGHDHFCVPK
jgi:hypothetical protein